MEEFEDFELEFYTAFAIGEKKILGFNLQDLLDIRFYLNCMNQTPQELGEVQ